MASRSSRVHSGPVPAGAKDAPLPAGEDEFRLIADSAPVAVWVTRLDRRRSFVNRAYVEFVGLPYEEALALDWQTIAHPDDAERIRDEVRVAEARLETCELIARYRRKDGAWRWLHSTSRPRWDAEGRHIGFIGVAHDVTEAKEAELALREREAQASAFINQATAGFGQVDLEGRFTLVNDRFCEIAGWSREELIGRSIQSITHPDDWPRNAALFEAAARKGTPYTHEKRYLRKDGGIVWVNNSVSVIRRPDGEPFGVLAVTLDVTERRESEAKLRKSEETLRLAIQSAGMASWELDLDAMEGEWSPNRFDLLGMERTPDSRGTLDDWLRRIHPDDLATVRDKALRCFVEGAPYTIEYRILRADSGAERWVQSHGTRIDYADDRPSRFVGISFDITERKRAEEKLRASEARYRTIFEQANDFLITTDLDHIVTSVNPAVCAAIGYREDEIVGQHVSEFVAPDQYALLRAAMEEKLEQGGGTSRLELEIPSRDGRKMHWDVSSQLTTDADGRPNGLHAISRDVTEARRAEAHLRLLVDELNHRVKNTLAIVQGIAQQTFKAGAEPAAARRAFEGRLAALSEAHNLLTREHWGPVSMTRIIHVALTPHGDCARFALDGPDLTIAPKTAISLALAFHELATNAVKHGALSLAQGRVTIRWERAGSGDAPRLRLVWTEHDGPPVVPPKHRGFGTRMIERGLAAELGGRVKIDFAPAGLVCTVDAPLPEVGA